MQFRIAMCSHGIDTEKNTKKYYGEDEEGSEEFLDEGTPNCYDDPCSRQLIEWTATYRWATQSQPTPDHGKYGARTSRQSTVATDTDINFRWQT